MMTVTAKVQLRRIGNGKKLTPATPAGLAPPMGRVPRASRLVAIAIKLDRLVRDGKVADQSELARLARVTQPRMTQILNLTLLAPDIIEALLHLPLVMRGRAPIHEKLLRPVAALADWGAQRVCWVRIRAKAVSGSGEPDGGGDLG